MIHRASKKYRDSGLGRAIKWAIIVLTVALVILLFFLVRDYRSLRRAQVIDAREMWLGAVVRNHGHLTASNVTEIRSWMTFDYINKLFNLPPDYLKIKLSVMDARYPQLSLSGYARSEQMSSATIIEETMNAIRDFFGTSVPAAPSSTGI